MTTALDTSVIVAALVRAHPQHALALPCIAAPRRGSTIIATHAVAEAWATLTALPLEPRLSGDQARDMLARVQKRLKTVAMSETIYRRAIERCVARGLRSGAVYDALHLCTAEAQRASVLLTFNVADLERLVDRDSPEIRAPAFREDR